MEEKLEDKIQWVGEWWAPSHPEEIINGILTYDQSGNIELDLVGVFGEFQEVFTMEDKEFPVIHGFTTKGKKVTLINCIRINFNMSMPGILTEQYSPNAMLVGQHFENIDNIKLTAIKVAYDYLELWLSPSSYTVKHDEGQKKLNIEYTLPKSMAATMRDTEISIDYTSRYSGNLYTQVAIQQTGWFKFSRDGEFLNYSDIFHFVELFSNLLTIASAKYVEPVKILVFTEQEQNIELVYKRITNVKNNSEPSTHDFIFRYPDIADWKQFLNIWNNKYEILKPVIHYFVDAHKKEVFSQVSFLKLVQALESFSRRLRQNWVEDEAIHAARVDAILSDLSDEQNRDWLRGVLKYVNEPSLNTRLKSLFKETNFLLQLNSKKISSYAHKVVETRNYYTHFDENKKQHILSIDEMFYLGELFIIMLRVLILKELGFPEQYIAQKVDQKGNLSFIKKGLGLP